MQCTRCGTELLDNAEFCTNCGAPRHSGPEPAGALRPFRMKIGDRSFMAFGTAGDAAPPTTWTLGGVTTQIRNISNKRRIDALLVNAGLGGAFGLLMGTAFVHFIGLSTIDELREIFAIVTVGVVVVKFIEPIAEHFREALHIAYSHQPTPMAWSIKLYAVLIVAGISLADGMLHSLFMHKTTEAAGAMLGYAVSGLIPAGITYSWLRGVRCQPSRANLYGLVGAVVIAPAYLGLASLVTQIDIRAVIIPSAISWGLIAFAGGLAIDKKWAGQPTRGMLLSTLAACVLVDTVFGIFYLLTAHPTMTDILQTLIRDVGRTAGWGVALMLYPAADSLFAPAPATLSGGRASATFAPERNP